jgi:hypothetical protein
MPMAMVRKSLAICKRSHPNTAGEPAAQTFYILKRHKEIAILYFSE